MNEECAIWGTSATIEPRLGDYQVINSPRAGGMYWISGSAEAAIGSLNDVHKLCLTTWLCDQRAAGIEIPRIDTSTLSYIKARKPLSVSQRLARALLLMSNLAVGKRMSLRDDRPDEIEIAIAKTESSSGDELVNLFRLLGAAGQIESLQTSSGFHANPTISGWIEIERLTAQRVDYSQAFVAMWFDPSTDDAYNNGIAPAIESVGYKPMKINNKEHINKIDDEIIAEIRRSRFLVADFTCPKKQSRGGVYYEAGFAQGLGVPVIWTCNNKSMEDVHFDTRQFAHIVWETPQDLFEQLKNRIGAVIGDGPLPKT